MSYSTLNIDKHKVDSRLTQWIIITYKNYWWFANAHPKIHRYLGWPPPIPLCKPNLTQTTVPKKIPGWPKTKKTQRIFHNSICCEFSHILAFSKALQNPNTFEWMVGHQPSPSQLMEAQKKPQGHLKGLECEKNNQQKIVKNIRIVILVP